MTTVWGADPVYRPASPGVSSGAGNLCPEAIIMDRASGAVAVIWPPGARPGLIHRAEWPVVFSLVLKRDGALIVR